MKKNLPFVSIILPSYNSFRYLPITIESIINQTYKNWELLIVDDGSTDSSFKILNFYKKHIQIKVYTLRKNFGVAYCRNFAKKKAKGKYIAFIDSDDIWDHNKLKEQINFMEKNKYHFTATNFTPFQKNILPIVKLKKKIFLKDFLANTSIATSSMICSSKICKNIRFRNFKFDDMVFKISLLKKVPCYVLEKNLLFYRKRENSISSRRIQNIKYVFKVNNSYLKLGFLKNIRNILLIGFHSIKKYNEFYNFFTTPKPKLTAKKKFFLSKKKYYNLFFNR